MTHYNVSRSHREPLRRTGLADFENDNRRAEAVYRDTTRGMSDEAIRLELSQDKLRRSLAKGPAAYREQARAELQLRNSERALRGETDALTRSQSRNTAGLGGLKRSIIGLGAAYVGAMPTRPMFQSHAGNATAAAIGSFETLRVDPELTAEHRSIDADIERPPDKVLAFVASMPLLYGDDVPPATSYACPMHPEVTSSDPGTCPKCGMQLLPVRSE
jgi:hypothetical protein